MINKPKKKKRNLNKEWEEKRKQTKLEED